MNIDRNRRTAIGAPTILLAGATLAFCVAADTALAQERPVQSAPSPATTPAAVATAPAAAPGAASAPPPAPKTATVPAYRPGFLAAVGGWMGSSFESMRDQLSRAGGTLGSLQEQAAATARDAASAIRIPTPGFVSGHAQCRPTGGGPDCRPAVEALCKAKGYTTGQSIDIQSADKCPAWVWASGTPPQENICSTETFVTRAFCR